MKKKPDEKKEVKIFDAVIDLETTGLYPGKQEIIEIGVVLLAKEGNPIATFHHKIKPQNIAEIMPAAIDKNKIDINKIPEQYTPEYVKNKFLAWMQRYSSDRVVIRPIGHNYLVFDIGFMRAWLGQETYSYNFNHRAFDTCIAARILKDAGVLDIKGASLDDLCQYYRLGRVAHTALEDACITLEVYRNLCAELENLRKKKQSWMGLLMNFFKRLVK